MSKQLTEDMKAYLVRRARGGVFEVKAREVAEYLGKHTGTVQALARGSAGNAKRQGRRWSLGHGWSANYDMGTFKIAKAPCFDPDVEWLRGCAMGERGVAQRIERLASELFIDGEDEQAQHLRSAARMSRRLADKTLRGSMVRALKCGVPLSQEELKLAGEDIERVGRDAFEKGVREEGADPAGVFFQMGEAAL